MLTAFLVGFRQLIVSITRDHSFSAAGEAGYASSDIDGITKKYRHYFR